MAIVRREISDEVADLRYQLELLRDRAKNADLPEKLAILSELAVLIT